MKNRVNLFPADLKPKLKLFTVNLVLLLWALSCVTLFAVSREYQKQYDDIQAQTRNIQEEFNSKSQALRMLKKARDDRAQDPALVAAVEKLQREATDKRLLLDELRGREQLKNQGFSMLMRDLSNQHVDNIWLTRINIEEQKIRIEGGTLESSSVPIWVNRLKSSDYFAGRSFAGARMFRDDSDELNFVISSDLIEVALEAEAKGDGRGQP